MAAASLGGRRPSGAVCGEDAEVKWSREKTCTVQHMPKNMGRNTAGNGSVLGVSLMYIYYNTCWTTNTRNGTQCVYGGLNVHPEGFYERVLKGKNGFQLVADIIFQLCYKYIRFI